MSQSRSVHYAAALLVGLGIGVIAYRYGVLGFFWNGSLRWVFPGAGIALIVAGLKLPSSDDGPRPSMPPRISLAILGIGASMGLLYLAVPPLSRMELVRRELPGFSFELPRDKPTVEKLEYAMGQITYKQLDGANAVLAISWQAGGATTDDLEIGMNALAPAIGGNKPTHTPMPGPDGAPVQTMSVDTDKGAPLRMSLFACGKRSVLVMSIGISGIDTVHGRILKSFRCSPDPKQESAPDGVVRVALTLPGWFASEKAPSQVILTDGSAALIMREVNQTSEDMNALIVPLFNAFGGKFEAKPAIGDRVPFTGTMEGESVVGWARRVACPTNGVLLVAMASNADEAERVYVATSSAGCLRAGEVPPVWPDAPADLGVDNEAEQPVDQSPRVAK